MGAFTGPRGLKGFARIETAGGHKVELQESSAVASFTSEGLIPGPFVWLRVEANELESDAHLDLGNAIELRDALNAFIEQAGQ